MNDGSTSPIWLRSQCQIVMRLSESLSGAVLGILAASIRRLSQEDFLSRDKNEVVV